MTGNGTRHRTDVLAEYAAGALAGPELASVEAHLIGCPSCRAALLGWTALAAATAAPVDAPPDPASVVRAVLTRAALSPQTLPVRKQRLRFAGQLLRAELRLASPAVWLASALAMACAVAVAAVGGHGTGRTVLSLIAPLVAVAGAAGLYGPQRDPAFEALAVTVTSPRLVLLARVTLVFGYHLALAVAASAVVRLVAPEVGLVDLVSAWLGPMTLLLALSLLLAMWIGPNVSMAVAASLWVLRLATIGVPGLAEGWLAARCERSGPPARVPSRRHWRAAPDAADRLPHDDPAPPAGHRRLGRGHRPDRRRGHGRQRLVAPLASGAPPAGRAAHLAGAHPVPGRPGPARRGGVGQPGHGDQCRRRAVVLRPGRRGLLQVHQWSRRLYLFATTRGTVEADWTANRLTLLAAGVAMTTAGWLLLRRPSRLLTKEAE